VIEEEPEEYGDIAGNLMGKAIETVTMEVNRVLKIEPNLSKS
jgi:hypothetical protein